MDRRRFFREGLRELFKPVSKAIEPIERVARELGNLEHAGAYPAGYAQPPKPVVRPPGALLEEKFLETCSRCGKCAEVCPAQCIRLDDTRAVGGGAPYIDVETMPCVLCDGLLCMPACPTGALVVTPLAEIDIGTAQWRPNLCTRTVLGDDCRLCVEHCPLGEAAIRLDEAGRVQVIEDGCIGCGVCEHYCPTTPQKAIVIIPKAQRDSGVVARA